MVAAGRLLNLGAKVRTALQLLLSAADYAEDLDRDC
jgi:hypothetical protein